MAVRCYSVIDSAAMERLGAALAAVCTQGVRIYLNGPLGAGKTTLVRGYLHGLGVSGIIKSPTYTLVEPYTVSGRNVYHFDLYRLESPEALEWLGFRDYLTADSDCLVEWPEQAAGVLPDADIDVAITLTEAGRAVTLRGGTARGRQLIENIEVKMTGV